MGIEPTKFDIVIQSNRNHSSADRLHCCSELLYILVCPCITWDDLYACMQFIKKIRFRNFDGDFIVGVRGGGGH